jgi:hypothetical protein
MLSRAVRAWSSPRVARDTLTRARAASRVAVRRSTSALEMNPRSTSFNARSRFACARLRSAWATPICARAPSICWFWTERSIETNTWPWRTQSPWSTGTETTRPPSPTEPTGSSRRAASEPLAVIVPAIVVRPGVTTVTTGTWLSLSLGAASPAVLA